MLALNLWWLLELLRLIRDSGTAAQTDPSRPKNYNWLKPSMHRIELLAGHALSRMGEVEAEAFLIGSGEVHVIEYGALVRPGDLLREIGLLATDNPRTATAVCRTPMRAWRVSDQELKELCLQNPQFCLYLATVIARHYEHNLRHTRREVEAPAGGLIESNPRSDAWRLPGPSLGDLAREHGSDNSDCSGAQERLNLRSGNRQASSAISLSPSTTPQRL
jgi:hypothetical protein